MRPRVPQLVLGGVPDLVVGGGVLELLQIVDLGPRIRPMLRKRLLRPVRQGRNLSVVLPVKAEVVADLTPGHELVEKRLHRLVQVPPASPLATGLVRELPRRPVFPSSYGVQDLMRGDVAEMQVARKLTRGIGIRVVALGAVAIQSIVEEPAEGSLRRLVAARLRHRRHRVVDR